MQFIEEPFFTDDGFQNPVAEAQLEAAIMNMPPTYERLADNPEWTEERYTFLKDITGGLAMWAVRQSPFDVPDGLAEVLGYLSACLRREVEWDKHGAAVLSLCGINKLLHEILMDFKLFQAWNEPRKSRPGISFVTAESLPDPDHDFIDLDAVLHNVSLFIRDSRREFDRFNAEFEAKWKGKP